MRTRGLALIAALAGMAIPAWPDILRYSDPKAGAIQKVCVLPAEATLTRVGMKGGERLSKESDEWAVKLNATLKHAIAAAGGQVTGDLSPNALEGDDEARQSVVQVKQKYRSVSIQMRKKPNGVKAGRYSLGDEVSLVPCAGEADSLAFLDAAGMLQSGGRKAFDILIGGAGGIFLTFGRYNIWIAMVDARTGKVKALLRDTDFGGKTGSDPEAALTKRLTDHLKKLHVGASQP